MKKSEAIKLMKQQGVTFHEFSLGEEFHGWTMMFGRYEMYLENLGEDKTGNVLKDRIFESDLA